MLRFIGREKGSSSHYLDYDLWVRLRQTAHAIDGTRTSYLSRLGLTIMEAGVLFIVKAMGNKATPVELSRLLFREPHTMSHLLSRMEVEGLVTKVKDLERKNVVRVALTDKGQLALSQSTKIESIHEVMSILSEEERQQMLSHLERLLQFAITKAGKSGMPAKASDFSKKYKRS